MGQVSDAAESKLSCLITGEIQILEPNPPTLVSYFARRIGLDSFTENN